MTVRSSCWFLALIFALSCAPLWSQCDAEPATEIACEWEEGLDLYIDWTNNDSYDAIFIDVNGEEVAELEGSATVTTVTLAQAGVYSVAVRVYDETLDCMSVSEPCEVEVGLVAACDLDPDDNEIPAVTGTYGFVIEVAEDREFYDLECLVDFSTDLISDWALELTNPDGTSVQLFDQLGNSGTRLCAVFSDHGLPNTVFTSDEDFAGCNKIKPHAYSSGATGFMRNLAGGRSDGDWALTVDNREGINTGELDEWCVYLVDGCPIEPVTGIECEPSGISYPVTLTWTNNDPDEEYSEHSIFRNGVLIETISGGEAESFTDASGPGGRLVYTVVAYSEESDCIVASLESCELDMDPRVCASDDPEFSAVEMDANDPVEIEIDTNLSELMVCLAEQDGMTDDDLSPTEDGRVDISDLNILLAFNGESVETFTWTLESPEGTSLTLWDSGGGDVEWGAGSSVTLSDGRPAIPDSVPVVCNPYDCQYAPAGPGVFSDFVGEDALGVWTLEGETTLGGELEDYCLRIWDDQFTKGGGGLTYVRGDVNGDGVVTALLDAVYLLGHYYADLDAPPCFVAADVDASGLVSPIVDALRLLQFGFTEGAPPPAPFPTCGVADFDYEYVGVEIPCESTICDDLTSPCY